MAKNKKRQGKNPVFFEILCVGFTSPIRASVSSPDLGLDGCLPATLSWGCHKVLYLSSHFVAALLKVIADYPMASGVGLCKISIDAL